MVIAVLIISRQLVTTTSDVYIPKTVGLLNFRTPGILLIWTRSLPISTVMLRKQKSQQPQLQQRKRRRRFLYSIKICWFPTLSVCLQAENFLTFTSLVLATKKMFRSWLPFKEIGSEEIKRWLFPRTTTTQEDTTTETSTVSHDQSFQRICLHFIGRKFPYSFAPLRGRPTPHEWP
jgi:hypothetical protein